MRLLPFKITVLLWVAFAFMGQTIASSHHDCKMKQHFNGNSAHAVSHDMSGMQPLTQSSRQHVNMQAMLKTVALVDDCCSYECKCPHNVNPNMLFLLQAEISAPSQFELTQVSVNQFSLIETSITSLYRPPILA